MSDFKFGLTEKSKKNINAFPKEFMDSLEPAFEKIMLQAESKSKQDYFLNGSKGSPVNDKILTSRTGNLRRIITSEVKTQSNQIYAALIADIEYAATNEYGDPSRGIKERAFLYPAIKDIIEDVDFEDIIIDEIDKRTKWL